MRTVMKIRNLIYTGTQRFLCVVFVILLLSGCGQKLELVSEENITDATFWKTANDYKLAANRLYQGLDRFGFEDTESDIAFNFPNSISNGRLTIPETSDIWNTSYTYIRACNNILEKGTGSTDIEIKRFVAEAKFFRAWYYWKLVRKFGGLPLITKVLNTGDAELFTPRSSQGETIDFMLKDLDEAQNDLPAQSDISNPEIGRISKGAALALRARVALYQGTWEKFNGGANSGKYIDIAIAASQTVISSGNYALYNGSGAQSYRYLFIEAGDDSKESMLDRRYARNILGHDMPYQYHGTGYNATKKLADMYLDTTGLPITHAGSLFEGYNTMQSEFQKRDPRMTMTMIVPGKMTTRAFHPIIPVANYPDNPQGNFNTGYIQYKYISEDAFANNSGQMGDASMFDYDRHLIRYAEVLLIYAEAVFEKSESISDADLNLSINLIRARAGMPHLTNAFVTDNNLDMRNELRRERTIELAFEGFRYDDVRRWGIAETEMAQDVKGIKIKGSSWQNYPLYSDAAYQNRTDENGFLIVETGRMFRADLNYVQPLPAREVAFYTANGYTLEQNPNW
jgi:starch-binding outer membrane protein, SusD/RagB family